MGIFMRVRGVLPSPAGGAGGESVFQDIAPQNATLINTKNILRNSFKALADALTLSRLRERGFIAVCILLAILFTTNANAGFIALNESFMNAAAPGWVLGGTARLTSGSFNNATGNSGSDASGAGYLRLTDALNQKQGFAYYNQSFSTANGIIADFEYKSWSGGGADGLTMFMFDGDQSFANNASYGGGLGYCNLSNAMIGVGLDEYGNFSNPSDMCVGGGGPGQKPETVVLRGPASSTWKYLGGATTGTNIDSKTSTTTRPTDATYYRRVRVQISPTGGNNYTIIVSWATTQGGGLTTLISQSVNLVLPANAKVGFAGSTGGSVNVHELRNMVVTMVNGDVGITKTAATTSDPTGAKGVPGEQITYTVKASNNGGTVATGATVNDLVPNTITGVTWTCAITSGVGTCVTPSGSGNNMSASVSLNPAATATYTIKGIIAANTNGTAISNIAQIIPPNGFGDVDNTNNTANVSTQIAANVVGSVYNDLNKNAQKDGNEVGTGLSNLYVTMTPSSNGVCQSSSVAPAAVATVSAVDGTYTLPSVAQGNYCLILTNKSTLPNTVATIPNGWASSEGTPGIRQLTVSTTTPLPQNFGLYSTAGISGRVFADTGAGGGTANDGLINGGEVDIANVVVNAMSAGSVIATATTASDGSYTLVFPPSVTNPVTINEIFPTGYIATGGSAGTTGGTYTRGTTNVSNATSFTYTSGSTYSGVNFANVPVNTLSTDGAQTAQAGSTVFYTHTFVAGSGGTVRFSSAATASPANTGWSETIYRDTNCSATMNAPGDPILLPTTIITVTAGQTICLILKEFIPANAALNAANTVTVVANFTYINASPALSNIVTRNDLTTVGTPAAMVLLKQVRNVTQSGTFGTASNALPGETLEYQLTATNQGSVNLDGVMISDATPAFTGYVSAVCPVSLPPGLTACAVATQPAGGGQGPVQWIFTGTMTPTAQTVVTYRVKVSS